MGATFNYPTTTENVLTAISCAYQNEAFIGGKIAPKVKAPSNLFKYNKYNQADGNTLTETKISVEGETNRINFSMTQGSGELDGHGLHVKISNEEIREAALMGADIAAYNIKQLTNTILAREEVAIATAVQNASNYNSNNKDTLSGTTQWDDYTNSNPVKAILKIQDKFALNSMGMGGVVWYYLRRHPKMIQYFFGANATVGNIEPEDFRVKFGFKNVFIGKYRANSADLGIATSMDRVWTNKAFMLQVDASVDTVMERVGMFFNAYLPLNGMEREVVSTPIPKGQFGTEGGIRYDILEKKQIVCTADDLGYLWIDATNNDYDGD